ncbi:hypothetical protein CHU98_g8038 [Xylaria longipes]|nr:hypothetical protein CHU98_g8038 [Xylaria longipes]
MVPGTREFLPRSIKAETHLVANVAKGYQIATWGLVNTSEDIRIFSRTYSELHIPPGLRGAKKREKNNTKVELRLPESATKGGLEIGTFFRSSTVHDHGKAAETKVAASRRPIARALHQHQPSDFPPEFYDNLSKIWLTPRALRELDRRNRDRFPKPFAAQKQHVKQVARAVGKPGIDLSRPTNPTYTRASSSTSVSGSKQTQTTRTSGTFKTPRSKRSSAFDDNFIQHCIDYSIYPHDYMFPNGSWAPEPANLEESRQALKAVRALGNLRIEAKENRDRFIEMANTRARGGSPEATDEEQDEDDFQVDSWHPL